ncbi:hypothetical protein E4U53_000773 [Claviceps sorghi]|nr:hypothetical protein E4U53_000773 [Claviceps sorghi]
MERHHRQHVEALEGDRKRSSDGLGLGFLDNEHDRHATEHEDMRSDLHRGRRSSDPTSCRPLVHRNRPSRNDAASRLAGEEIEDLPDRFDHLGRRLDGQATRQGTFQRQRQRAGGWDVEGAWQVSGTDGEAVDRLVKNVVSALEGHGSWMGVLQDVLGSGLLVGTSNQGSSRLNRAGSRTS